MQVLIRRFACDRVVNIDLRHGLLGVEMRDNVLVSSFWSDSATLILDSNESISLINQVLLVWTPHRAIV